MIQSYEVVPPAAFHDRPFPLKSIYRTLAHLRHLRPRREAIAKARLPRVKEDFAAGTRLLHGQMDEACLVDERDPIAFAHAISGRDQRPAEIRVDDGVDAPRTEAPSARGVEAELSNDLSETRIGRDDYAVADGE